MSGIAVVVVGAACSTADDAAPPTSPSETSADHRELVSEVRSLLATDPDAAVDFYATHRSAIDDVGASAIPGLTEVTRAAATDALRYADGLFRFGQYQQARTTYEKAAAIAEPEFRIADRLEALAAWEQQVADAVPYSGPVRHMFFHSVIDNPALAFDGDSKEAGYREWMVTKGEFVAILSQLHDRGFILIDPHLLYTVNPDGTVTERQLQLPAGKIPVVLSIDDVSYYPYMAGDGFPTRLELDPFANVATRMDNPGEPSTLTLDGDLMGMLDLFVLDNPDFSFQGFKGVVALTGYAGVLGYRTNDVGGPNYAADAADAQAVAARMRELGWQFACHSYGHLQGFKDVSISMGTFVADVDRWEREVQPIIGRTDMYISPFGYRLDNDDPRYRYLIEQKGFRSFYAVSGLEYRHYWGDSMVMDRINVDGFEMVHSPARLEPFFDVDMVYDTAWRGPRQ